MEHFDLGFAPADEACGQLGVDPDYGASARRECRALIGQLDANVWDSPPAARFRIMANPHDFGTYYSVVIEFDPDDETAVAYACHCDEASPREWDTVARAVLAAVPQREGAEQ